MTAEQVPDDLPALADQDGDLGSDAGVTPSAARRALARTPLAARPTVAALRLSDGVVDLSLADLPTRPDGTPRGLGALFAARPASAPPVVPLRASVAATLSAPQRIESEWLVTIPLPRLHYAEVADLGLHGLHDLATAEVLDAPSGKSLRLKCSQLVSTVAFPGPLDRSDEPRCPACCGALGYPAGDGSPANDAACRPVLGPRIEALQ